MNHLLRLSRLHPGSKRWVPLLLSAAVLLTVYAASQGTLSASGTTEQSSGPQVLVGLVRAKSVSLTCSGAWSLTPSGGGPVALHPGGTLTLTVQGGKVAWQASGGKSQSGGNVLVAPSSPVSFVGCQGRTYRGKLIAMADGGDVVVANAIQIEEYVQSVVGGEIPDGWPLEANRAQAIAARSYAAYKTGLTRDTLPRDYVGSFERLCPADILIWATDQVYRGTGEETAVTVEATLSTRGQLLTYGGAPVAAYYHSDAGGMTEDPCHVWGRSAPGLSAVLEEPHESPHASWTVVLTPSELAAASSRLGFNIKGEPDALYGVSAGASGRWYQISLRSGNSAAVVRGNDLRTVLPEVKSTLFSSYMTGGGKPTTGSLNTGFQYSVVSAGEVRGGMALSSASMIGRSGEIVSPGDTVVVLSGVEAQGPSSVVLQGQGWGHGVGMSQWGARGMALGGSDALEILLFYYPDAVMDQWW